MRPCELWTTFRPVKIFPDTSTFLFTIPIASVLRWSFILTLSALLSCVKDALTKAAGTGIGSWFSWILIVNLLLSGYAFGFRQRLMTRGFSLLTNFIS